MVGIIKSSILENNNNERVMQKRIWDILVFFACLAGLIITFHPFSDDNKYIVDIVCLLLGGLGILYCAYYLFVWIARPIRRDWLLIRGAFLWKVVCFVFLVPFILTLFIMLIQGEFVRVDKGDGQHIEVTDNSFKQEMLCDENIYCEALAVPHAASQEEPHLFWSVYYHFIDPGNQHMASSPEGRGWTALIAILGLLLLNGLLVSTLINYFDRRKEQWQSGRVRYGRGSLRSETFAVVIGAHNSAAVIIRALLEGKGEKSPVQYVVLLTNESAQEAREKIESFLTKAQQERLVIYNGQLGSYDELDLLHLHQATEIYVLGENSIEDVSLSYHDTQNMKCVHLIAEILNRKKSVRKIVCHVLFEYQTIFSVFQFSDVAVEIKRCLDFVPFSNYEDWAQCVFVHNRYQEWDDADAAPRTINYVPLDTFQGIGADSDDSVHFVVVGMSKMGIAMAIQAAQIAHYPNFCTKKVRTRITFIDSNADVEMNFFKGRYHNLFDLTRCRYFDANESERTFSLDKEWTDLILDESNSYHFMGENFLDIEWEFIKGNVEHPHVASYLEAAAAQPHTHLTVAICLPQSHEALAAALYMPAAVYESEQTLQVLVYQRESSHIVYNLYQQKEGNATRYTKLHPFGMDTANFTMHDAVKRTTTCAQYCAKAYDLMFDDKFDNKNINSTLLSLGANAAEQEKIKAKWVDGMKVSDKWSNQYLANSFATKLRSVAAADEYQKQVAAIEANKDALAKCEHNRWMVQQLLIGFRACTQGEVEEIENGKTTKKDLKNGIKKAHYNICSFEELSTRDPESQGYDALFNRAIPAILQVAESHSTSSNNANS